MIKTKDNKLSKISFNSEKVGFFRYKKLGDNYLLTNEIGEYEILDFKEFTNLIEGKISKKSDLYKNLASKGFLKDEINIEELSFKWLKKNSCIFQGPALFIIVVTRRCNYSCIYCQTSSLIKNDEITKNLDMTVKTAQKVLDLIFSSPSKKFTIEFQGGEPLLNWKIIEYIVNEAKERSKKFNKDVNFSLVTNLSLMNNKYLKFLIKNNVSICTSLDGPRELNNKNRPYLNGDSYKEAIKWWKKIKSNKNNLNGPDALLTVTRESLRYPKEIVDEYVKLKARAIYIRFLSPFGRSKNNQSLRYTPKEFLDFYKKSLDYIIELNLKGKTSIIEFNAKLFLTKILKLRDPNFMDLRSPCGASIGQMAFNYDGKVYTCDEGRMLAADGIEEFCIGNVNTNTYNELINSPVTKCIVTSSLTDIQNQCSICAYKPYCGICPIFNFVENNDLYMHKPNFRCEVFTGILDTLFEYLQKPEIKNLFEKWVME
jgi:His-Xaa-Ser system radical SAM maturase HxsB